MNKITKYVFWTCCFLIISCSNFSNLCKHGNRGKAGFTYSRVTEGDFAFTSSFRQVKYDDVGEGIAAVEKITWETLEDVTLKSRWNEKYQLDFMYPIFGKTVKKLKGKEVYITGYMIPLNINGGLYAISRYNNASCFFCGGAGPESLVSLKFKTKPKRYKTDAYLTMKGTFELNDTDVNEYFYIFRDTEEVKER